MAASTTVEAVQAHPVLGAGLSKMTLGKPATASGGAMLSALKTYVWARTPSTVGAG